MEEDVKMINLCRKVKNFPRCIIAAPGTMTELIIITILQEIGEGAELLPYLYECGTKTHNTIALWVLGPIFIQELNRRGYSCPIVGEISVYGYKGHAKNGKKQKVCLVSIHRKNEAH